ncbi:hypothetical protein RRG08_003991 [Elysia crispata]|uniref:Uncharacterized protein n=1 Tax=Elysia crispata TaxID=231223 RepID=A0AAE0Y5H5_9GAST|nr:hypothetical protein RRG08_003991 [Elysia crispata]
MDTPLPLLHPIKPEPLPCPHSAPSTGLLSAECRDHSWCSTKFHFTLQHLPVILSFRLKACRKTLSVEILL